MITYDAKQTDKITAAIGEMMCIKSDSKPLKTPNGSWEPYIKLPQGMELLNQKQDDDSESYLFEVKVVHAMNSGVLRTGYVDAADNEGETYNITIEVQGSGGVSGNA